MKKIDIKPVKNFENFSIDEKGNVYDSDGNIMKLRMYHNTPTYYLNKKQVKQYIIYYNTFGKSFFHSLKSLDGEIWLRIKNHPNYAISNLGRAKNLITEKELPKTDNGKGYERITLDAKNYYVHRIVAENFIGEIQKDDEIDHINCDKKDNKVSNLRIVTPKENMNNPLTVKKMKQMNNLSKDKYHCGKWVIEKDLDGNQLSVWRSIKDAAEFYGVGSNAISNCLNGWTSTSCGKKWEYFNPLSLH